ncbi:MAG TPA: hypothetical protein P5136_05705 [Methanofastidiosum sp.]|nr:hypothetical protein [Methanofastidiosum sp.]
MNNVVRGNIVGIIFIDQEGDIYPTPTPINMDETKTEREERIIETFLKFQEYQYHKTKPKQITGRDCPWDFTYDNKLHFEITSINYNEKLERVGSFLKEIRDWKQENNIQRNLVYVLTEKMSKNQIIKSLEKYFTLGSGKKILDTTKVDDLNILLDDVKKLNWEKFVIYEHTNAFPFDMPILLNNEEGNATDIIRKRLQEKANKKYIVEKELTVILDNHSPILQESIKQNWNELIELAHKTNFKEVFLYTEYSPEEFVINPLKTQDEEFKIST